MWYNSYNRGEFISCAVIITVIGIKMSRLREMVGLFPNPTEIQDLNYHSGMKAYLEGEGEDINTLWRKGGI